MSLQSGCADCRPDPTSNGPHTPDANPLARWRQTSDTSRCGGPDPSSPAWFSDRARSAPRMGSSLLPTSDVPWKKAFSTVSEKSARNGSQSRRGRRPGSSLSYAQDGSPGRRRTGGRGRGSRPPAYSKDRARGLNRALGEEGNSGRPAPSHEGAPGVDDPTSTRRAVARPIPRYDLA